MRVLLYSPAMYPKVDGVSLRTSHLLRNLKDMGHQVVAMTPIQAVPDVSEGVQVIKLPAFVPLNYYESMISYPLPVLTLLNILRQFKPDIVHFIGPEFVFIPLVVLCKLYNIPIIGSYHFYVKAFIERLGPERHLLGWINWMERTYNFADYVITPSKPMQQILIKDGMRCDDVWPPAVDSNTFNPRFKNTEMRSQLTWGNPDAPLMLYVGRVASEKSMELLPYLLEAFPNAYLAIVGTGPDMAKWAPLHGAKSRIFCSKTHWSGNQLSQAYAAADVFVMPSAFETLGNVVLESLASGVPVVGCNAGGIPHLLRDNENGYLFEVNDVAGMCAAVGKVINDPENRERLGRNGLAHVSQLSWRSSSEYVEGIYKHVITKHGRVVPGVNAPAVPVTDKGPYFVDPSLSFIAKKSAFHLVVPWLVCIVLGLALILYAQFGLSLLKL